MSHITALVSVEDTSYMWWQAQLLARSLKLHVPSWEIVWAISTPRGQVIRPGWYDLGTVVEAPHLVDKYPRDQYVPWHKPLGFKRALDVKALPETSPIMLLDPDMILLRPIPESQLLGNVGTLFNNLHEPPLIRRLYSMCGDKTMGMNNWAPLYAPVGFPMMLENRAVLESICNRWEALLMEMRGSPGHQAAFGWWSEMWAFVGAAIEARVKIEVDEKWTVSTDYKGALESAGVYWIHYCNTAPLVCDKRDHTKAMPLGLPPVIIRLVQEWCALQEES